jgi:hypothetical protein
MNKLESVSQPQDKNTRAIDYTELVEAYQSSPYPSLKLTNYFKIYADTLGHLRNTACTFIETGILNGGSLFMWRKWLGAEARIIGVDLNPEAKKWEAYGFEIHIGDQGDPKFWESFYNNIGQFDAFLDDGGHQSFQQIVTATEAIRHAHKKCVVLIEDTHSNFMQEFSRHRNHSFLEYAKDATDILLMPHSQLFPNQFPPIDNMEVVTLFKKVHSMEFFTGIVAFKIDPVAALPSRLVWNMKPLKSASDFRYHGVDSLTTLWPDPFSKQTVTIFGGKSPSNK